LRWADQQPAPSSTKLVDIPDPQRFHEDETEAKFQDPVDHKRF
jgi:hypothetical protein